MAATAFAGSGRQFWRPTRICVPSSSIGWRRAGRQSICGERGLRAISFETIYAFIFRAAQKTERLWRYLVRGRASRGRRRARNSQDRIREKVHVSQRSEAATARQEAGHWEGDLIICRRARPVLVLHERKTRLTLTTRLAGKTAGETIAAIMAVFRRLEAGMRSSITFDNDTCFAHHALPRGMLGVR